VASKPFDEDTLDGRPPKVPGIGTKSPPFRGNDLGKGRPPRTPDVASPGFDTGTLERPLRAGRLECSYLELEKGLVMDARIEGAGPTGFEVRVLVPGAQAVRIGAGTTDALGTGEALLDLPGFYDLPTNTEVAFVASFLDSLGRRCVTPAVPFLVHPKPLLTLDFEAFPSGAEPLMGTVLGEQWSGFGLHVSALSASRSGPDLAMLYDSAKPRYDDMELLTPGSGPMNTEPRGSILVVAENDLDSDLDGVLDFPDSADLGGTVVFTFDREVYLYEIALIDIDAGQSTALRGFRGDELVHDFRIPDAGHNLGDNNLACLGFAAIPVSRLEIELGGSGGIAELSFLPATSVVDFDRTMTGTLLGLRAGTVLDQQLMADQGMRVRGDP
jgi:hypothetical protein